MILQAVACLVLAAMVAGVTWFFVLSPRAREVRAKERHARCLSSIARLELELFPEWFLTPAATPLETLIRPGECWFVGNPYPITTLRSVSLSAGSA